MNMTLLDQRVSPNFMNRRIFVVIGVVLLHVGVLWALQSGLLRRAVEVIVAVEILSEFISPPAPPAPIRQSPPPQANPVPPRPAQVRPAPPPAQPTPSPQPEPTPTPVEPAPPVPSQAPASIQASTVAAAPGAPPAPARIELPSSDAAYLNNPKPAYPVLSRRLGEQGRVVVRVLIGADGTAQKAEIAKSSGYSRLDQTALATVLKWRYVPGTRNGQAETMSFDVPISFVLE